MKRPQWNVELYLKSREFIASGMSQQRISEILGVSLPTVACLEESYRGETEGHLQDLEYLRFLRIKMDNPDWRWRRIHKAMPCTPDRAKLLLARFDGVSLHTATLFGNLTEGTNPKTLGLA